LIARREGERLDGFMKSYGVLVAYLHDIGLIDFRPFGRALHPEFASQSVFDPGFDYIVDAIWQSDCGGIASRLRGLANAGALAQNPRLVLRELLKKRPSTRIAYQRNATLARMPAIPNQKMVRRRTGIAVHGTNAAIQQPKMTPIHSAPITTAYEPRWWRVP
jgi:hypothetical protein